MKLRRVCFALGSVALVACGLDITGVATNDITQSADASADATTRPDVITPNGDDDDQPIVDAGHDAAPIVDAAGLPDATTVASNLTDLRSIAVTMDGKDLYVVKGGTMSHYPLTPQTSTPTTVGDTTADIRAIVWADDLKAVLFVGNTKIGRYNQAGPLTDDTHSNEGDGVDIAYAAHHMVGGYTTKVTSYDPTTQQIGAIHECATGENGSPSGVAIDANNVYWADHANNSVGRTNIGGGSANAFVSSLDQPTSVAVDPMKIYVATRTAIVSAAIADGSGVTTLAGGLSTPTSLVIGGNMLFWLEADGTFKRLMLMPNAKPQILGVGSPFATLAHQHLIAYSGAAILWGNPTDGTVKRLQ